MANCPIAVLLNQRWKWFEDKHAGFLTTS